MRPLLKTLGAMITRQCLSLLLLTLYATAAEWSLPAANQGEWAPGTDVGVPGGMLQYIVGGVNDRAVTGNVINITQAPYSADNTGVTNCHDAVASAMADASEGDVIYFPAGTYLFESGFLYTEYKDNITIRGAGPSSTTFRCSYGSGPIFICSSPGDLASNMQTVTGTKTKGTTTLGIPDTTGYSVGRHVKVYFENETDDARIIAGAAPFWHSLGTPYGRAYVAKITNVVANTSITVAPGIPGDATNLRTGVYPSDNKTTGWGFEDFSVSFDESDHPTAFVYLDTSEYCWVYNVHFLDWSKTTSNGSCVVNYDSYRNEIRKCVFHMETGSSSDGAIGTGASTSCLIVDNIFTGPWDITIYDNGNACNNVVAYNFSTAPNGSYFHNFHPSLNIFEGNYFSGHQSDGYHGSSSHNTLFRNSLWGPFGVVLNRFKRHYVIAGNFLGVDGTQSGNISYGNPNIGNGLADGFAGPTGLSDQVGQIDFSQPGYSPNTYVIQASDVFEGDFWQDWKVTGTLTTRTSDTVGVFAVSGGKWFVGDSATGGGSLLIYARWGDDTSLVGNGTVTDVSGSDVTVSFASGVLPAQDTVVKLFFGPAGWQERDLDVKPSCIVVANYWADAGGTGSVQDDTDDTLPDSLVYSSRPTFFGTLAWPPFDPHNVSTQDPTRIPAGYRYINGNENYLSGGGSAPTYSVGRLRFIRR